MLDAVSDARRDGFAVGEDYTVTDRSTGGSRQQRAARLGQAQGHADFIRHRVGALLATDRDIATRVKQGAIGRVDRVDVAGGHAPGGSRWRGLAEIHRLHPILGRGVDPGHVFERQLIEALGGGASWVMVAMV